MTPTILYGVRSWQLGDISLFSPSRRLEGINGELRHEGFFAWRYSHTPAWNTHSIG